MADSRKKRATRQKTGGNAVTTVPPEEVGFQSIAFVTNAYRGCTYDLAIHPAESPGRSLSSQRIQHRLPMIVIVTVIGQRTQEKLRIVLVEQRCV